MVGVNIGKLDRHNAVNHVQSGFNPAAKKVVDYVHLVLPANNTFSLNMN